ncbi:hypothetical protein Clacol_009905 [Clathrus columnatus]|uniref:Large ribosomal subunit protein uL29m n=1 Tax=Clathrus columnatus TaxID=1419009 RepID=A0AAV5APC5_9AGAM|nr:hypothetical protein Clacol_009905 [Clathrus columnatus]
MLTLLRRSTAAITPLVGRTYATTVNPPVPKLKFKRPRFEESQPEGPLRSHLNVEVNPNHGLFAFFRRRTEENSYKTPAKDGPKEYVALERPVEIPSGRAWKSVELRRKSFKDLHTLWYILLRERNLIDTQKGELRRFRLSVHPFLRQRARECRLSMTRIKQHLTERSKAYMQAAYLRRQLRMNKAQEDPQKPLSAQITESTVTPKLKIKVNREESLLEPSEAKSQVIRLQAQISRLGAEKTRKKLPTVTPEEEVRILKRRVQKAERDERMDLSNILIEPKTYMGGFTRPRDLRASNWFPGGPYVLKGKKYESPSKEAYASHTVFLLETRYKVRHGIGRVDSNDHIVGVCRTVDWPKLIKFYNGPRCPGEHQESLDNACWPWLPRSGKVIRPVVWWGKGEKLEDIMKEIYEDPDYVSPYSRLLQEQACEEENEDHTIPEIEKYNQKQRIEKLKPSIRVGNTTFNKDEIRQKYFPIIQQEPFWRPLLTVTLSTRPLALTLSRLSKALPRGLPFYASMSNDDRKCLYSFSSRMTNLRLDRMRSLTMDICSHLAGDKGGFVGIRFSTESRGRGIDGEGLADPIPRDKRLVKVMIGNWFYRAEDEVELYRLGAEEYGGSDAIEVTSMNEWGKELDAQGNEVPIAVQEQSNEDLEYIQNLEDEDEKEEEEEEEFDGAAVDSDGEDLLRHPLASPITKRKKFKPELRENTKEAADLRRKLAYRLGATHRNVVRVG